jgi:hypothetical protein
MTNRPDDLEAQSDLDLFRYAREAQDLEANLAQPAVQVVLANAQREGEEAFEDFLTLDPTDAAAVRRCQWRALKALSLAGWFASVLEPGRAAEAVLRERDFAESKPPE